MKRGSKQISIVIAILLVSCVELPQNALKQRSYQGSGGHELEFSLPRDSLGVQISVLAFPKRESESYLNQLGWSEHSVQYQYELRDSHGTTQQQTMVEGKLRCMPIEHTKTLRLIDEKKSLDCRGRSTFVQLAPTGRQATTLRLIFEDSSLNRDDILFQVHYQKNIDSYESHLLWHRLSPTEQDRIAIPTGRSPDQLSDPEIIRLIQTNLFPLAPNGRPEDDFHQQVFYRQNHADQPPMASLNYRTYEVISPTAKVSLPIETDHAKVSIQFIRPRKVPTQVNVHLCWQREPRKDTSQCTEKIRIEVDKPIMTREWDFRKGRLIISAGAPLIVRPYYRLSSTGSGYLGVSLENTVQQYSAFRVTHNGSLDYSLVKYQAEQPRPIRLKVWSSTKAFHPDQHAPKRELILRAFDQHDRMIKMAEYDIQPPSSYLDRLAGGRMFTYLSQPFEHFMNLPAAATRLQVEAANGPLFVSIMTRYPKSPLHFEVNNPNLLSRQAGSKAWLSLQPQPTAKNRSFTAQTIYSFQNAIPNRDEDSDLEYQSLSPTQNMSGRFAFLGTSIEEYKSQQGLNQQLGFYQIDSSPRMVSHTDIDYNGNIQLVANNSSESCQRLRVFINQQAKDQPCLVPGLSQRNISVFDSSTATDFPITLQVETTRHVKVYFQYHPQSQRPPRRYYRQFFYSTGSGDIVFPFQKESGYQHLMVNLLSTERNDKPVRLVVQIVSRQNATHQAQTMRQTTGKYWTPLMRKYKIKAFDLESESYLFQETQKPGIVKIPIRLHPDLPEGHYYLKVSVARTQTILAAVSAEMHMTSYQLEAPLKPQVRTP
jgi:hypothetical protein